MKIAFIGQKVIPAKIGGTQKYVEEVSLCMAKKGHEIFVYATKENVSKKMLANKNIEIIFLSNIFADSLGEIVHVFLASVHALFANYDVVHYQSQETFFLSKIVKMFKSTTKIVSSFDLICEFQNKPIVSANNSKDIDAIWKWKLRDRRYVLFAENLSKQSGAHYLIEAFKQLEDTAKTPNNFKLVLAEVGERDEDYLKYLHTISEDRSNIILIKKPTKKIFDQLFSHAYLFVQPSDSESSASLLTKAMLCGLAPLVSDTKENLEVIESAGISFASKSVIELRDKLAYLLSRNDEVIKYGKLAKEKIEKQYSWETIAHKTIEAYENY